MKIFIDAGFYVGKALDYYAPFLDDSWEVYIFEPNLELNVEERMKRYPFSITWVQKAVWTENGETEFRLTGRNDASHIDSMRESTDPKVIVPTIDFSEFLSKFADEDTIVCSMDIEGAEYPVLRKLLRDKTAQKLDLLDIEFHQRLLVNEDEASSSALRRELESEGVLVKLKLEI